MECSTCKNKTYLVENSRFLTMTGKYYVCYLQCYICENIVTKKTVTVGEYDEWSASLKKIGEKFN